jgi:hypothetical protein
MPEPAIVCEFAGLPSVNAARAGAGGHPCLGLYRRRSDHRPKVAAIAAHHHIDYSEQRADVVAGWIDARW